FLTNTTTELGEKTPKNFLKQKGKKNWSLAKAKASNTLMKKQCPSPPTIICICQVHLSVPLHQVNLSKSKFSTGRIQMSKEPKPTGTKAKETILMLPCPEW